MNPVRHADPCQVAVVRTALRETLSNPTLMSYDPFAIVLALEELAGYFRQQIAADSGSDTFAAASRLATMLAAREANRPTLP